MRYCVKCLQPDTRPNTAFSSTGVCPACIYFASLEGVDWDERRLQLLAEIAGIRSRHKSKSLHDCIIGVSGGKDSTRQALWVRDNLGLDPLLVLVSYPPRQLTEIGAANAANLMELGFDFISIAPAPETWRDMMKYSFLTYANWAKSTELALFSGVPQLAIEKKIPIVLWGENPSLQLGDIGTRGNSGLDGNQIRFMNTLGGADNDWLRVAGFTEEQLIPYQYPSTNDFERHDIQILFLGWVMGDWSLLTNGIYSALSGLKGRTSPPEESGDLYGLSSLDEDYVSVNQMIKYYKYGFGRATEYVNEMIRSGQLSRVEALAMVQEYDGACSDELIRSFCEFIDIPVEDFWTTVRGVTNPDLFDVAQFGRPKRKFEVGRDWL